MKAAALAAVVTLLACSYVAPGLGAAFDVALWRRNSTLDKNVQRSQRNVLCKCPTVANLTKILGVKYLSEQTPVDLVSPWQLEKKFFARHCLYLKPRTDASLCRRLWSNLPRFGPTAEQRMFRHGFRGPVAAGHRLQYPLLRDPRALRPGEVQVAEGGSCKFRARFRLCTCCSLSVGAVRLPELLLHDQGPYWGCGAAFAGGGQDVHHPLWVWGSGRCGGI